MIDNNWFMTSNGFKVYMSPEDIQFAIEYSWHYNERFKTVSRNSLIKGERKTYYLRRVIAERMGLSLKNDIISKDLNPLNLRRENLIAATRGQSNIHRSKQKNNKLGLKGVIYREKEKKYRAQICNQHLGYFKTAQEAAKAYDEAALEKYGEFAVLNFPKGNNNENSNG